jgi:squalene monooxygenase
MQPGGCECLKRLGLGDVLTDERIDAIDVHGYTIVFPPDEREGMETLLEYPAHLPTNPLEDFGINLPEAKDGEPRDVIGKSFHHHRVVNVMREKCREHPNITFIEGNVKNVLQREEGNYKVVEGVEYKDNETGEMRRIVAPLTVVCDGIGSSFRSKLCDTKNNPKTKPWPTSSFSALILHHPNHTFEELVGDESKEHEKKETTNVLPHYRYGHVIYAKPSPILLYQISSTETRVLVDMLDLPSAAKMRDYLLTVTLPQLPLKVQPLFREEVETRFCNKDNEEFVIHSMTNRFHSATLMHTENYFGLAVHGDANNIRHALTGSGMSAVLQDVEIMTDVLKGLDLDDSNAVHKALDKFVEKRREGHATTINVLATALHAVFSDPQVPSKEEGAFFSGSKDPVRNKLREACFEYLNAGGYRTRGPVNLLSCVTPKPWVLITHFFFVAFYAIYHCLFRPSELDEIKNPVSRLFAKISLTYRVLQSACAIIFPLLQSERYSLSGLDVLADLIFRWSAHPITMTDRY